MSKNRVISLPSQELDTHSKHKGNVVFFVRKTLFDTSFIHFFEQDLYNMPLESRETSVEVTNAPVRLLVWRFNLMNTNCISCQETISTDSNLQLGSFVTCPKCDARLEIVWLAPVELDWPADEYDDDDEGYDDDY